MRPQRIKPSSIRKISEPGKERGNGLSEQKGTGTFLQTGGKALVPFLCSFFVSFVLRLAEQMKQTEDPLTQLRLRGGTIAVKQDGIVEQIRQGRLIFPQRGGEQRDRVEIDEQAFIPALRAALRAAAVGTACRWSASFRSATSIRKRPASAPSWKPNCSPILAISSRPAFSTALTTPAGMPIWISSRQTSMISGCNGIRISWIRSSDSKNL